MMTLNQARDILAAKYPNRTVSVDAECWYRVRTGKQTTFNAYVFGESSASVQVSVTAPTLDLLLAAVDARLAPNVDAPALATAEVEQ